MDLQDTTNVYRASECLAGSWSGLLKASPGRQIPDVTGRSVTTPRVRDKLDDIEGETPIDKEAADRSRANSVRAQYLSIC